MKKKALVTGAAGFIGSHLVDRLLTDGWSVTGVDNLAVGRRANLKSALDREAFAFHELDVNDVSFGDLCVGVDTIFHLAALADIVPSIESPGAYYRANADGTFAVLEAARAHRVRRLLYAASSSCYGIPAEYPTPETAPIQPEYPYALTKYLGECLVLHWGKVYGMSTLALRLFNVYGPRARTSGTYGAVFGVFLAQKLNNKPFTVVGDGTQTRDFTYVSDVVDAFVCAAASDVRDEAINVGSGGSYSVNELVRLLGGDVTHIPKRPGEPDCTFADVTKAQRLLGWRARVRFDEGVEQMLAHLNDWRDAPVWDPVSIDSATRAWFTHLGRGSAASQKE